MEQTSPVAPSSAQLRLALAWAALAWERLWIRLWLPVTLAGLFFAVALTDVLAGLTPVLHVAVVALAAAAIAAVTWRRVKGFALPSRHEARARLEAESPVGHRPLTAVEDQLVDSGDAVQQALWEAHQRRARGDLARLRARAPAPNVAARDHFALRAAVILALFVALIGGSGTIQTRLFRNLIPTAVQSGPAVAIKMWITPPAYTGRSPIYIESPSSDRRDPPKNLEIADGSKGLFVITGAPLDAGVAMDKNLVPLERLADASQHGEFALKPAKRLDLLHGGKPLAGFDVTWIPDKPPVIAFTGPAATASRWRLKFDYKASDDYGIQNVTAHLVRTDIKGEPFDVELSLPPFASKVITQSPALDLAAHPWAGQKVRLSLKAVDQAGQTAESDAIDATLPERVFTHPVAKEIIAQRKALFADAGGNAQNAAASVTRITKQPESFGADPLTHLALAAARYRLQAEPPAEAMATVPDLLWHAAVRIEDGNLTLAEQRLATAEQALRDALEKGAPQEEINKKIAELQQALADYQKAKTEKQENNFAANQGTPPDIQKMMEQLKQMNDMGAKEGARQQLAELQDRLQEMRDENMELENESAPAKAAQKLLSDMQDLTKNQAGLVDKNFEKARAEDLRRQQRQAQNQSQNQQGNQGQQRQSSNRQDDAAQQQGGGDAAMQQEALRQELSRINEQIRQLTGKPQISMDEAGDAMAEARDSLKAGSWKNGVEAQSRALSKLQESAEQAQQDLAEAMFNRGFGGLMDQAGQPQFRFGQGQRGRAGGNNNDVDVPMGEDPASMAARVRAILEEIRTRASDRTRPAEEQDYLKRLMKQF